MQYFRGKDIFPSFVVPRGYPTATGAALVCYDASGNVLFSVSAATSGGRQATASKRSRNVVVSSLPTPGRTYWLGQDGTATPDESLGEQVEVRGHNGVDTAYLKDFTKVEVASGGMWDCRLRPTASVSVAEVERNCRMVWEWFTPERFDNGEGFECATVGCVAMRHVELVDFVDDPFELSLTLRDVEKMATLFGAQMGEASSALELLEQAEDKIYSWLRGRQIEPDQVKDRRVLKEAAIYWVLRARHIREDAVLFERFDELYKQSLAEFDAAFNWIDKDIDVFLATGDLLERARDLVVELVELTFRVLEIRVDVVIVLVHLIHVHAPILTQSKEETLLSMKMSEVTKNHSKCPYIIQMNKFKLSCSL